MSNVLPVAQKETALPVKSLSPKKEFERLIRDIRAIIARSRFECSFLVDELTQQGQESANNQIWYTKGGANGQLASVALLLAGTLAKDNKWEKGFQAFQVSGKVADFIQARFSTSQTDHQTEQQRIGQALAQHGAFDQRMLAFLQSIEAQEQRMHQMEQQQFMNQ